MSRVSYAADVIVVGTGAGGAAAACALAEAGADVLILEEGAQMHPHDHGGALSGVSRMYLHAGFTVAMGKPMVALPMGSAVGGTTIINSSTCFRPPEAKVKAWDGVSHDELLPFVEEVEQRVGVRMVDMDLLGGNGRVLKRGCDSLGVAFRPLAHNVGNCEKRGLCAFGCAVGAKNSTDRTFIPEAQRHGARLISGARVTGLITQDGTVRGVRGKGTWGRFEARAKAVVLAMGALRTPGFLLAKGPWTLPRSVGRNLAIHPAVRVVADMGEEIVDGFRGLPQGGYIDHWAERDVMLEGIFTPPGPLIASLPGVGHVLKDLAARYRHLSAFGVMASDTTRGRVFRNLPGCPPLIYYSLNPRDAATIKYGVARLTEVYLAAGAKRVYTGNRRVPIVDGAASLAEFERLEAVRDDYDVMAFHPVGTCRMGLDPSRSAVGPDLGVHGISGLYVMDASVIPDSLGVNPQITIMALALRGGRRLAESL